MGQISRSIMAAAAIYLGASIECIAQERYLGPIIDMHQHARNEITLALRPCKPAPCEQQPTQATSADQIRPMTIAAMERNNIVLGVVSDPADQVFPWTEGSDLFRTNILVRVPNQYSMEDLRGWFTSGRAQGLGEITTQYEGIPIDDPSLRPLFALAHELDLPVHVHVLGGGGSLDFPIDLGNPLRLTPVLREFPGLRIQVENAGWPFLEEITALLYQFPSVYADVSTILSARPPEVALRYVKGLVDNGLEKRFMFGSDQMIWPETIDIAVEVLQSADFLTAEQKADIFYNNAARFLRLSDEEIARHRRAVASN